MGKRVIFHIDVNSAFLSWEAVFRLRFLGAAVDLRRIPSAIGGDAAMRRGIILAKSIPASTYGIRTGEGIWEARQKCRNLYIAPPDYGLYETCSEAFIALLKEYSPDVEQYSIDEAYMDMSGMQGVFGNPVDTAHHIRERIREELGFTVNIGISENKLLAKMAGELKKPDRVHTLYLHEIQRKMWPLPAADLFFVGRASAKKLSALGIHTIGELARTEPEILKSHLKKHGEILWAFANGIDLSPVLSQPPSNKGYGNSTTTPFDITDRETAGQVLLALSETVAQRLRRDGVEAAVVAVGIKSYDFQYASHRKMLPEATDITNEIYRYACQALDELWDGTPLRHLGVHTSHIRKKSRIRQQRLFEAGNSEKWERLDRTVDGIRCRQGNDALIRAVFLNSPIDYNLRKG